MILSWRNLGLSTFACASVAAIVLACGSKGSTFPDDGTLPTGTFSDGSFGEATPGQDLYANDPPPPWCGPDSGTPAPPILGTEDCPDDKNKPGCACDKVGDKAPCWTGLRKQRNLGICKDGVATCIAKNETLNVWGECEGEVLPVPNATGGQGCGCFSVGTWDITNTSPCLRLDSGTYYAYSTVYSDGKATFCGEPTGTNPATISPQGVAPAGIWSPNTLKVDCAGTFKLCFRIRQGDFNNPSTNDCILGETCTDEITFTTANQVQSLPDLKTWAGTDTACANKWENPTITPDNKSPGYGEMIVKGKTVHCDDVGAQSSGDFVFHRVEYCPRMCRNPANATDPICQTCQLAGKGSFN
jgi:hypothetical protein